MDLPLPPADRELSSLADVVWVERAVAEQLAFKLVALNLVLVADLRRYVGRCVDEVEAAWDQLERAEERRTAALEDLARAWDRPAASLELHQLAELAPEPWATVFADHRDQLRPILAEVAWASTDNARICGATLGQLDHDLGELRAALPVSPAGRPGRAPLRLVGTRTGDGGTT